MAIYHLKCAGVVRTQLHNSNVLECSVDGTTWTAKLDCWQDSAPGLDVANGVLQALDVAAIRALPPVRDPTLPRSGTVVERQPPVDPPVDPGPGVRP